MSNTELVDNTDDPEIRLSLTASNIQLPDGDPDSEKEESEDG